MRPVTVSRYTERTATVTDGIKDGEQIVLAGVHTVFAGQHVKPVKPLFSGEGDVDGPASGPAASAGAGASTVSRTASLGAAASQGAAQ